ncbi:MAG: phosphotransferase [Nocardioidaceae bacterium]|nr:phosphotransferase [Nocardioidaceae bacterium]
MNVAHWTSEEFLDEVRAWVAGRLAEHGLQPTGEWEQPHAREWSSAIRFETTGGRVWFKVNGRATAFEPRLVRLLADLSPGLVPDQLATDVERAWSLSRDGGPQMRAVHPPDALWKPWEQLVSRYAGVQRDLAAHTPALLDSGTPHLGPTRLVAELRGLRERLRALPAGEGGISAADAAALEEVEPVFAGWCDDLAASPVAESVQHDDLHSANVCWPGEDASAARIIDWGDASVAHPFGTMLATLNSIAFHAGVYRDDETFDDPRVDRVRDAYLEPFTDLADRSDLLRWVELARRTGCVSRALSYEAALADAPAVAVEMEHPVREWLLALLEPWALAPVT